MPQRAPLNGIMGHLNFKFDENSDKILKVLYGTMESLASESSKERRKEVVFQAKNMDKRELTTALSLAMYHPPQPEAS
jgi:hypothetical protein